MAAAGRGRRRGRQKPLPVRTGGSPGSPEEDSAFPRALRGGAELAGGAGRPRPEAGSSPWKAVAPAKWAGVCGLVQLGSASTSTFAQFATAEKPGASAVAV